MNKIEDFRFIHKMKPSTVTSLTTDRCRVDRWKRLHIMDNNEYRAAVAAFIRANGITRCPTACALPTQGTVAPADRAALKDYAASRDHTSNKRLIGYQRSSWLHLLSTE